MIDKLPFYRILFSKMMFSVPARTGILDIFPKYPVNRVLNPLEIEIKPSVDSPLT